MSANAPRTLLLAGAGLGLLSLGYGLAHHLGYRLPGFDRHPTWQQFPHLTNPRLAVARVPDFARRYGSRFHLPEPIVYPSDGFRFDEYYRANLRNVRALGFQQTGNEWTWHSHLDLGNGTAPGRDSPPAPPPFRNVGYEYLEVTLAGEKSYCKEEGYQEGNALADFYQYNYPTARQDTLFVRYQGLDYRVSVR